MNRTQRNKNRENADRLRRLARARELMQYTCENCGDKGGHWVETRGISFSALMIGQNDSEGFWACPKLYGADGRRISDA